MLESEYVALDKKWWELECKLDDATSPEEIDLLIQEQKEIAKSQMASNFFVDADGKIMEKLYAS